MSKCPNAENLDIVCECHECNPPFQERILDGVWLLAIGNRDIDLFNTTVHMMMAGHREEAAQEEQARIIKLLDSNEAWQAIDADSVSQKRETVNGLIALIKGEN